VLKNECYFALGSRFLNNHRPKTPVLRILGSRFISKILSFLISQSISDPTSGFRAMNEKTFSLFTKYYPHDYPEVEELLFLAKNGFRIKEIPINMRPRIKGKSSLTLGKTFFYMFKVILVLLLDSLWLIKFKNKRSIILK
ncbi:MAG: glycosyltransferase family 2 protein, partial [Candidatus Omnitrophota bacterium]